MFKIDKKQLISIFRIPLGSVLMMGFLGLIVGFPFSTGELRALFNHIVYLSLFLIGFTLVVLIITRRAYIYYLLFTVSVICLVIVLGEIAYVYSGKQFSLPFSLAVLIILVGLIVYYHVRRRRIRNARKFNIASGRLNLESSTWDFQHEFHLDDTEGRPSDLELWWRIGRWIAPFGPALGYWLSRTLGEEALFDVFSALFLVMLSFIAWAGLSYLGLMMDLREIEQEQQVRILIPGEEV